jgi:ribosomal protein S18 acetylase RimI-like enzyme
MQLLREEPQVIMKKDEMVPIKNFLDALEIRDIRNQCRNYMTNDTSEINSIQQLLWYFKIYKRRNKNGEMTCFLFKSNSANLGFGLIRKLSGKYWITGGLMPDQRGKGFGKILFRSLIKKIPSSEVWLEVLSSNNIAKKIYKDLGFEKMKNPTRESRKIEVMRLKK